MTRCPSRFGGHGHCGIGDTMVLVWQMISQDYVTKGCHVFNLPCNLAGPNDQKVE